MTRKFLRRTLVVTAAALATGPLAALANTTEHLPPKMTKDDAMMGGDTRDMVTAMAKMAPMMDACAKMMQSDADPSAAPSERRGG